MKFNYNGRIVTAATKQQAIRKIISGSDKKPVAYARIGAYDVEEPCSGRPYIEMDKAKGKSPIIVTEEDPNVKLENDNCTFISPDVDKSLTGLLVSCGMAKKKGTKTIDPNNNGGFKASVVEITCGSGDFILYSDNSFVEDEEGVVDEAFA